MLDTRPTQVNAYAHMFVCMSRVSECLSCVYVHNLQCVIKCYMLIEIYPFIEGTFRLSFYMQI